MVVAVAAGVVQGAFNGVYLDVHTDLGPVALDQLQAIHRVRIQRGNHVDREKDLLPVRAQAEFLSITFVVADAVEDVVGLFRVVAGELARQLLVVPGVAWPWPHLVGLGLPQIHQVDDLFAVHAQRKRLAEVLVGEHLAHLGVFVGQVQVYLHLLRAGSHQLDQAVAAFLHVLRQCGLVLQRVDVALLDIEFARQCVQHQRLHVLRNTEVEPVDIGQLLAALVYLPEIGVALHHHPCDAAGIGLGDDPWIERRLFDIAPARRDFNVTHLATEERGPIAHVCGLGLRRHILVVLGVELAAVVLGEQGRVLAQGRGQLLQEQRVWAGEREFDRGVIDFADHHRFVGNHQRGRHRLVQLAVLGAVFDRKHNVVGGERLAVRPLHAGAQCEGELGRIGVDFPLGSDTRQHLCERQVPAHEALIAHHAQNAVVVGTATQPATQSTPVHTHLLGLDYQRHRRQALRQRGQFALADHLGQQRRLFRLLRQRGATNTCQRGCTGKPFKHLAAVAASR